MVYVCTVTVVRVNDLTIFNQPEEITFDSEEACQAWIKYYEGVDNRYRYGVSNGRMEDRKHIPHYSRRGMP